MIKIQIKRRGFLIALLIIGQAVCVGFGVAWTTRWVRESFALAMQDEVAAEGRSLAYQLAAAVAELQLGPIEPGTSDWQKLQTICRETVIPHTGFVCVMRRDDGALLCHSDLQGNPSLMELFPGRSILINNRVSAPLTSLFRHAEKKGNRLLAGKIEFHKDLYAFTGCNLPQQNVLLAVYQSDQEIDQFVSLTIQPIMQMGYVLTAFTVGVTAILTLFLFNRYEDSMDKANTCLERRVQRRTASLIRTRNAVIFGLAKLADSRDSDTGDHLERIRLYVTLLATEMSQKHPEIGATFVADLAVASSLHDVGKVGIPDAVLLKPGKLTPAERCIMEKHTHLGSECLAAIQKQLGEDDFLELARKIADSHHEHWDGNGYPQGIAGKNIPIAARIVALADVYDALTSARPYKGPYGHDEAREWIISRSATQFDPNVVSAFVACEAEFIRINESYSATQSPASPEASELSAELQTT